MAMQSTYEDNSYFHKRITDINSSLVAELVVIFFPFLITIIVLTYKGGIGDFFKVPAWSLSAAVLSGKTIFKFASGIASSRQRVNTGLFVLIIAILLFILFAPALIIHSLMLLSNPLPNWLVIAQFICFALSAVSFIYLGQVSQVAILIRPVSG